LIAAAFVSVVSGAHGAFFSETIFTVRLFVDAVLVCLALLHNFEFAHSALERRSRVGIVHTASMAVIAIIAKASNHRRSRRNNATRLSNLVVVAVLPAVEIPG
jgi:hypothetical protein